MKCKHIVDTLAGGFNCAGDYYGPCLKCGERIRVQPQKISKRPALHQYLNATGCGKKTTPEEWVQGLPSPGLTSIMDRKTIMRFTCSKCGHKMSSGLL